MALQSIGQFLNGKKELAIGYVYHPDFQSLYLRKGYRRFGRARLPTLEIDYVVAHWPGRGSFARLVDRLHPAWNLVVCAVINPYLREHLVCRGFTHLAGADDKYGNPTYYLLSLQELKPTTNHEPRSRTRLIMQGL